MENFIIEEFSHYKVFLYGRKALGQQTDQSIHINLPSGAKAVLNFCKNFMRDNFVEQVGSKTVYNVFLRADKYPSFIDILRNEKPLFFYYNLSEHLMYITTTDEPVGEAELSMDS